MSLQVWGTNGGLSTVTPLLPSVSQSFASVGCSRRDVAVTRVLMPGVVGICAVTAAGCAGVCAAAVLKCSCS